MALKSGKSLAASDSRGWGPLALRLAGRQAAHRPSHADPPGTLLPRPDAVHGLSIQNVLTGTPKVRCQDHLPKFMA